MMKNWPGPLAKSNPKELEHYSEYAEHHVFLVVDALDK
jgi:hypothetical protein